MPAVDVAMGRSLRAGFGQLLVASLRPVFERRDVIQDAQGKVNDVKTAFSSWDNCMQAVYCKWPVIGIIIVGGLILISVVWCIVRCACCGLSCCCGCFQCLKCCGDCCGCCDPPKGKNKYLDEPFIPPHHAAAGGGYKSPDPMNAGPVAPFPTRAPATRYEPPQYAEFDVSKTPAARVHEDALPAMPSWEGAGKKKVLVEGEEVEMDQLNNEGNSAAGAAASMNGQNVPLMTGASAVPGPVSPIPSPNHRSPYSPPRATAVGGGYMAAGTGADPYGMSAGSYDTGYNTGANPYGQSTTTLGTDQGYGMAAGAVAGGGRSPQGYNNPGGYRQDGYQNANAYGQDQAYGSPTPATGAYGSYNQPKQDPYGNNSQAYARGQGQRSPPRGPPARQNTGGYPQPGPPVRQNTGGGYPQTSPARQNNTGGGYPQERMTRSPAPMTAAPDYGRGGANYNQHQQQQTYDMPDPSAAAASTNSLSTGFDSSNSGNRGYTRTPAGYGNPPQQQQQSGYQNQGYRGWQ